MKQWYCLYTKPNSEHRVSAALEWQDLETYLPMIKSSSDRSTGRGKPFFPCYLFLQADLQRLELSRLRWTPGLRKIIAFNNKPAPIPEEFIDSIRNIVERLEHSGGLPIHSFSRGDTVRIQTGPLAGLEAIFDDPGNTNRRVHILLEILGQLTRVSIDVDELEGSPNSSVTTNHSPRRTRGKGRRIKS